MAKASRDPRNAEAQPERSDPARAKPAPSLGEGVYSQTQRADRILARPPTLEEIADQVGLVADEDDQPWEDWLTAWEPLPGEPVKSPYRAAVEKAPPPECPNTNGLFLVNVSRNYAMPISCRSWRCNVCAVERGRAVYLLFERGIAAAKSRGERVRFITLTDGAAGAMTVADLGAAWNRLRTTLKREGKLKEYAACIEPQRRGALHLHVLCTGEFVAQRQLRRWAEQAGWGSHVDIRIVRDKGAAGYSSKLAAYAAKANEVAEAMARKGAKRVRPIRVSRGWLPGGLRALEVELGLRSSGKSQDEWVRVWVNRDGGIQEIRKARSALGA